MAGGDIEEAHAQLARALGRERHAEYVALVGAFLGGRVCRAEFGDGLGAVFGGASATLIALHNRFVAHLLERIAREEAAAVRSVERERHLGAASGAPQTPATSRLVLGTRSAALDVSRLLRATLGDVDQRVFADAMAASPVAASAEDADLERRIDDELAALCSRTALLAQASGVLPDAEAVRAVLGAWARAYGLDPDAVGDDHAQLLRRAVEAAVSAAVRSACASAPSRGAAADADGDEIVIDRGVLVRAARTERHPFCASDAALSDLL